ncbi:hypothetical protein [Enterobacter roggenkampii]|uniref:hypothetical protein n=1 Tax=Enterobacter roggenkampii TaxID=1812935 RepID=UPI0007B3336E|nr:hypothetical protein [Enterobacter roggenkampii]KZQ07611.1 hypothetical protein A3461_00110 [Enterobacter roggenkampii]
MSTITREWLQQKIADMEAIRDEIPFGLDEDDSNTLAALRIALASLEAEAVCVIDQSNLDYLKSGSDADVWPASRAEMGDVLLYRSAPPAPVSVPDAIHSQGEKSASDDYYALGWNACRAAMLQGSEPVHDVDNTNRQFESLGCAEDTSRRFKCTGLIVTSDERKMEIPHCSKHPETELQVNPFERLMSYPPQPVMYCPLCRPSVAERVEFDKQLRQWKEVK